MFKSAEVWLLKAIAERRLGETREAETSMAESRQLKASDEDKARYLRHVVRRYAEDGNHEAIAEVVKLELSSLPTFDQGWAYMMQGRAIYNRARSQTRLRRDEQLECAAKLHARAEEYWEKSPPSSPRRRLKNLIGLLDAYAVQSAGRRDKRTRYVLEKITSIDESRGKELKKKLRWSHLIGWS